jgi:hypothetical protein
MNGETLENNHRNSGSPKKIVNNVGSTSSKIKEDKDMETSSAAKKLEETHTTNGTNNRSSRGGDTVMKRSAMGEYIAYPPLSGQGKRNSLN